MKCGNCKNDHATVADVRSCYSNKTLVTSGAPSNLVDLASEFLDSTQPDNRAHRSWFDVTGQSPIGREYAATESQVTYLRSLLAERDVPTSQVEQVTALLGGRLTKQAASTWIDTLLALPKQAAAPASRASSTPEVPAGHYATTSRTGNNDLDFWTVDRPTDGRWAGYTFVSRVIGGHEDQRVRGSEAHQALEAILAAGPEQAARLYGQQIGRCGRCNRHLTDAESRAYGLGPDCRSKGW